MKKHTMRFISLIIIGIALSSCNDFLTENSQDLSYITGYDDLDEILLGDVYLSPGTSTASNDISDTYMPYIHFMSDEVTQLTDVSKIINTPLSTTTRLFGYYTWQRDVTLGVDGSEVYDDGQDWKKIYKSIVSANVVLSGLSELSPKDDKELLQAKRIKGEALFCRAADLFLLVNLYADAYEPVNADQKPGIPVKLTDYAEIGSFTRASVKEVYQQIVSDLSEATEALKDNEEKSIYRINYAGACLFFSRVYLYMQDYNNAISWAQKAIAEAPQMVDLNTFSSPLFSKNNESIMFTMGGNIIAENIYEYLLYGELYLQVGQFVVANDLYNSFSDSDLRKSNFFHINEEAPNVVLYDKQTYELIAQSSEISDCFTLRTAEAWLNLAEAYACSGDNLSAQKAMNTLLKNRVENSAFQPILLDNAELVHFIREERKKELCMEGHRWFDLRRYQVNEVYPETKSLYSVSSVIADYELVRFDYYRLDPGDPAWTLPIPKYEMDYNDSEGNNRDDRIPYNTINY